MTQNIDLKELERKAYLSYHGDGLLDIFLGLIIVFFSVGIATDILFIGSIFPPLGVPVFALIKRSLTVPRIGFVHFSGERKARNRKKAAFLQYFSDCSCFSVWRQCREAGPLARTHRHFSGDLFCFPSVWSAG